MTHTIGKGCYRLTRGGSAGILGKTRLYRTENVTQHTHTAENTKIPQTQRLFTICEAPISVWTNKGLSIWAQPQERANPQTRLDFFFFKQGCVVLKLLFLRTWGLSSHIMLSLQNKHSANIYKSNIPTCLHYIFLWGSHLCGYIFMTIHLLFTIIWTANHTGLPLWKFMNKKHKDTSSTSNWWHDWLSPNTNLLLLQYLPLPHSHSEAN